MSTPVVHEYGLTLSGDAHVVSAEAHAGHVLHGDEPFTVSFDPALINELD